MGRPCKCCGEWFTTQKLRYDNGEIKVSAFTDFFYDHRTYVTGKGSVHPDYGNLQTWDIHRDFEGGVSVFARGIGHNDSLMRFNYIPYLDPDYDGGSDYVRTRRVYDKDLKEIFLPPPNFYAFHRYQVDRYEAPFTFSPFLPMEGFNGGTGGNVADGDINYKEYRNKNYPIDSDDNTSYDASTSIRSDNISDWIRFQTFPITVGIPYTGMLYQPTNFLTTGGNSDLYSLFNWEPVYNAAFFKYNPNYTSIPSEYQMGPYFAGYVSPSNRHFPPSGTPTFLNYEVDFDNDKIYFAAKMPLPVPELGVLFAQTLKPSNSFVYYLFEMDFDFQILNTYEYGVEHEFPTYRGASILITNYRRPNITYSVPRIRIKNNRAYLLHVGVFGNVAGRHNEFEIRGGHTPAELDFMDAGPRRAYDMKVVDLTNGQVQPRFKGGVNYDKYHSLFLTRHDTHFSDVDAGMTFSNGSIQYLEYNQTFVDELLQNQYDESDLQQVLDYAYTVELDSETNNYIECHGTALPNNESAPAAQADEWYVDSVTGGYIVSTVRAKNGLRASRGNSVNYGENDVTTVNINFSAGDVATIVFRKDYYITDRGVQVYDRTGYRAIKYVKDTFFSHLSFPKDFDVDTDGNIYMLMNHDSLTLPYESSRLRFGEPADGDFPRVYLAGSVTGEIIPDVTRDESSLADLSRIWWTRNSLYTNNEYIYDRDAGRFITDDRANNVNCPFDFRRFAYLPHSSVASFSFSVFNLGTRPQIDQILSFDQRRSMIIKNGGVRPDGTEFADVLKIDGNTGELLGSAVYFNNWLSTGISHKRLDKGGAGPSHENGLRFFTEKFSGVPINCITVTDDGIWVGGGQVWPAYGTIGDYIPPRWPDFYDEVGETQNDPATYDGTNNGVIRYRTLPLDNIDCYAIPVIEVRENESTIPPGDTVNDNHPAPLDDIFVSGSNPTYISPAWNTEAIDIISGDFQWLVGWVDTSVPRSPNIDETLYNVPYNADSTTIPLVDVPNYNSYAIGGPAIQQDIYVDGTQINVMYDVFDLIFESQPWQLYWRWDRQEERTSVVTGICYTTDVGCFVPANDRGSGTPLKATYPYNLLLFDFDMSVKAKYYYGPSNMDYEKTSSQYIMQNFSEIHGMCSINNDIYITGNRRHDDIVQASGDEGANDAI